MASFTHQHEGGQDHEGHHSQDPEFQALRAQAQEAIADYAGGADFDWTISRLAPIGEKMTELLA